jgi:hypothetical protein
MGHFRHAVDHAATVTLVNIAGLLADGIARVGDRLALVQALA